MVVVDEWPVRTPQDREVVEVEVRSWLVASKSERSEELVGGERKREM